MALADLPFPKKGALRQIGHLKKERCCACGNQIVVITGEKHNFVL